MVRGASARTEWLIALGVILGACVVLWPTRLVGVSMMDEGAVVQLAAEILAGKRPYADAVHYAFPGVFYLTAAAFGVAGASMETARALATLIFAATAAVVYGLARWWLSRRAALGVVVLLLAYRVWAYPHWQILNYSSLAVGASLGALLAVGAALPSPRLAPLVFAGGLAAVAALVKQDSGLATTAALGLGVLGVPPPRDRGRLGRGAAFAAGAVTVLVAAAVGLAAAGILDDLVRETVLAPWYGVRHYPYAERPPLWPAVAQDERIRGNLYSYFPPVLLGAWGSTVFRTWWYQETPAFDVAIKLVFHLPWIVLVLAVLRCWRSGAPVTLAAQRRILLVLVVAAFLAAFNRPHDWVHLLVLYPPTLLLVVTMVADHARGGGSRRRALAALAWGTLGVVAGASAVTWVAFARAHDVTVRSRRGMLRATPPQASGLQGVLDALAATKSASAPLLALPYHPLLNFLAARRSLSRFYVIWPVDPESRRDRLLAERISAHPETLIVYSPTQTPHFPSFQDYAPELFRFLATHFEVARVFGGDFGGFAFLELERRPPSGGRSLLGTALAEATVSLEAAGGPPRVLTGAEREAAASDVWWPFVHALRVDGAPGATVAVAFPLTPGPATRLRTSYGQNPEGYGPEVRFGIAVRVAGAASEVPVFTAVSNPFFVAADRLWQTTTIDLAPWAGQAIEVVLRATRYPGAWGPSGYAGWGTPRLLE